MGQPARGCRLKPFQARVIDRACSAEHLSNDEILDRPPQHSVTFSDVRLLQVDTLSRSETKLCMPRSRDVRAAHMPSGLRSQCHSCLLEYVLALRFNDSCCNSGSRVNRAASSSVAVTELLSGHCRFRHVHLAPTALRQALHVWLAIHCTSRSTISCTSSGRQSMPCSQQAEQDQQAVGGIREQGMQMTTSQ